MCRRSVVGENIENNNAKNKGIKDYSFWIFNLCISSVQAVIGIIVVLVIMYKLIRHSNTKNWSRILSCILPCCSQPWNQPRHDERDTDNNIHFQNNRRNCRNNHSQRFWCSRPNQQPTCTSSERGESSRDPPMWPHASQQYPPYLGKKLSRFP